MKIKHSMYRSKSHLVIQSYQTYQYITLMIMLIKRDIGDDNVENCTPRILQSLIVLS